MMYLGGLLVGGAVSFFAGCLMGVYLKTRDEVEREDRMRRYR